MHHMVHVCVAACVKTTAYLAKKTRNKYESVSQSHLYFHLGQYIFHLLTSHKQTACIGATASNHLTEHITLWDPQISFLIAPKKRLCADI